MDRLAFNAVRGPWVFIIAGLAGGLAEVLWVGVCGAALGIDGWQVARGVAVTVLPAVAGTAIAPVFGLAVHFILSIALAAGFSHVIERVAPHAGPGLRFATAVTVLTIVWAVNFHLLLPWLNPAFVALLPPGVTLISKILFACALWGAFTVLTANSWRGTRNKAGVGV